jgi:hypothetical protein
MKQQQFIRLYQTFTKEEISENAVKSTVSRIPAITKVPFYVGSC